MSAIGAASRVVSVAAWVMAGLACIPVIEAIRGDFSERDVGYVARGRVTPSDANTLAPLELDTATAVIFVYHPDCSSCKANTDNWMRLAGVVERDHPRTPVVLLMSREDSTGAKSFPAALSERLSSYRLGRDLVDSVLKITAVPATVVVREGRVVYKAYGVIRPRRQSRAMSFLRDRA